LKPIQSIAPGLLHYGALHFNASVDVPSRIAHDMISCEIGVGDIKNNKIVVDFRGEGQCDLVARPLINFLTSIPVKDVLVIFNACVDVNTLDYHAVCIPNHMTNHMDWFEKILSVDYNDFVDRKFLCLIRRPSASRALVTKLVLDTGCDVRISFGSMSATGLDEYKNILPGTQLPLLIDGIIDRVNNNTEHDQTNLIFHSCAFNLVVESSSQTDPGVWRSHFITEKTFKAFGLRQIPLWFAVPGFVAQVRKLGFDLFDDIVDHSYDTIPDEHTRFASVAQQVKQLDQQLTLDQCQQLRRSLLERLNQNFELLKTQCKQVQTIYNTAIKDFDEN
jgi:hypothetical protein